MDKIYDNLEEYRKAVLSDSIKSSDIMKNTTLPESVYKYRKFDIQYLKESLGGNMFFSKPTDMNVNDSYDCKMEFDEKEVFKAMFPNEKDNILSKCPIKETNRFLPKVEIKPALIQNELHPFYQDGKVIEHIQNLGIADWSDLPDTAICSRKRGNPRFNYCISMGNFRWSGCKYNSVLGYCCGSRCT